MRRQKSNNLQTILLRPDGVCVGPRCFCLHIVRKFLTLNAMIQSRITSKAQTTVPRAVRKALGIAPGDDVAWQIEGDRVILSRVEEASDPFLNNFSTFTEWSSEADCEAFDNL